MLSSYNFALIAAAVLIGMLGVYAALTLLQGANCRRRGEIIARITVASVLLAATVWQMFLLTLEVAFPHLEPDLPWLAIIEAWFFAVAGGASALGLVNYGSRSIRNMALAGSFLSSAISCGVFASMSALAAPSVLAYDLTTVLIAMTGSSTACAAGFWLSGGGRGGLGRIICPALVSISLVILSIMSLSAILPFSDWAVVSTMPGSIAFRPVTVVFVGELIVTLVLGSMGAGVDLQAAGLVKRENERLRQLSESTFEALLIHRAGTILDANARLCELVGLPLTAIKGRPVDTLVPDAGRPTSISPATGKPEAREVEITVEGGELLPVEILSRDIPYAGGVARVTALRDIRERRAAEARIRFFAQHDPLTGLVNRAQFQEIIARQLALAKRDGVPVAVLCIDLDRFKSVNDTLGHQAGDVLLKQVAERLLHAVRASDTVARIGGDEFILLQTSVSQPDSAATLAERLIEILSEQFDLNGHQACIGASIGIAIGLQDGTQPDEVIRNADLALYRAKSNGRGAFCFFKLGMDAALRERREMEQDIAKALSGGDFELAFQPLFGATPANDIVGFEALLRWWTPKRGSVSPGEFIPLAEETGLIVPIGAWVLETACKEAASWPTPYRIAVNVSPRQLARADFATIVADILHRTGLAPDRLEIEITETVLIKDAENAMQMLGRLKALGVRIALDDFGTGYSSLSYLQRFPFDKVKIDKSFIRSLTRDASARAIVNAILAMCHQLRLEVTAEGVEYEDQLDALRMQNCDQIQGFLLGRPIPQRDVKAYLLERAEQLQTAAAMSSDTADPRQVESTAT